MIIKPSEREKYFDIFPSIEKRQLPKCLQSVRLREEVIKDITEDEETRARFDLLQPFAKEQFIQFCMGNRGLKITYDPFFKKIFDKKRIGKLISCIIGQEVEVIEILPRDSYKMSSESSIMIMDVIAKLTDGTIVNVEMQRITHDFTIHRAECYSSDIMMRQYNDIKDEKGLKFEYSDLRPVYVIVLMESAAAKFNKFPDTYIHKSSPYIQFDSGLMEENLFRYVFVSLDIFRKMPHNELSEIDAWMYVLSSDNPRDIVRVLEKYPEFEYVYKEIIEFRYNPKELLCMVSDAIEIMDRNAVKTMVDELKEGIKERDEALKKNKIELKAKDSKLKEKDSELKEKDSKLKEKDSELKEKDLELKEKNSELKAKDEELKKLKALVEKLGVTIPK